MSSERVDELTPEQKLKIADVLYKIGLVTCLFVLAAILTGTPPMLAGKLAPPGLMLIGFGRILRDIAYIGEGDDWEENDGVSRG